MKDKSKQKKLKKNTDKLFQLIDDNNPEEIKQLIGKGVDLSFVSIDSKKTPIEYAASMKKWSCVIAIATAQRENRKYLYRYGYALVRAVRDNEYDAAKSLIAAGAKLTYQVVSTGNYLLHLAVKYSSDEKVLTLLLDSDCDTYHTNKERQNPFELALVLHKWECAAQLLKKMPEYQIDNHELAASYLIEAIGAGQREIAELLFKKGVPVNAARPKDNYTSLHTAVILPIEAKRKEMIRFVVEHGGDQTALTKTGRTPIALASILGIWDAVQLLVELDKKHKGNSKRIAALQYEAVLLDAIKAGNYAIVKLMLEHGAPCSRSDSEKGNIALYWAVKKNEANPEIVSLLLQHGADPTIKNKNGQTILDLAREWGYVACLERLQFDGYTAKDVSHIALIKMYVGLKYGKKKHDKDLVDVCRLYAQNIFQALNDNAIADEEIQLAIDCLDECYSEIFKAILIRLNAKRDELKKSYSPQLVNYHYAYDPAFEINQLSALITFINTVLRSPRQDPPVKLLEHQHYIEAHLARQFVQTHKMVRDYHVRVRNCLREMNDKIKNTEWQVYKLGMWVKGMPKHMQYIQKILNVCLQSNNDKELLRLFLNVRSILTNLRTLPHRHPDVTAFYHEAADMIANVGFVTAENLLVTQSVKPAMGFWTDVTAFDDAANAMRENVSSVTAESLLVTQPVKPAVGIWTPASAPPMTAQTLASSTDLTNQMTLPELNEMTNQFAPMTTQVLTLPVDEDPPTYDQHMKLKRETAAELGLPPMSYSYLSDPNYQRIYPSAISTTLPVAMDTQTQAIDTFNQSESVQATAVEAESLVTPENVMADSTFVVEEKSESSTQQVDEQKMRELEALLQEETWEQMFRESDDEKPEEIDEQMPQAIDAQKPQKTDEKKLEEVLLNFPALPTHKPVVRVSQSDLYRKPLREQTVSPISEVKTRRMVADC